MYVAKEHQEKFAKLALTDEKVKKLVAAGIDVEKLLAALSRWAVPVVQLILAIMTDVLNPTPSPMQAMADGCPCPDGKDGHACCHAAQHHALLAALCINDHCGHKECNHKECCVHAIGHLMMAVEAASCCCNCDDEKCEK